jgi:hypothetical protein
MQVKVRENSICQLFLLVSKAMFEIDRCYRIAQENRNVEDLWRIKANQILANLTKLQQLTRELPLYGRQRDRAWRRHAIAKKLIKPHPLEQYL